MGQQPPGQQPPAQQPPGQQPSGEQPHGQQPPAGPPMQPPAGGAEPAPASGGGASYVAGTGAGLRATEWWKRLVAIIIDSIILNIAGSILGRVAFAGFFNDPTDFEIDPVTGQLQNPGFMGSFFARWGALFLALIVLGAAYYVILHGMRGQTVGKMAMKIKVVDEATGGPISYGTAFIRWILPGLVGLVTCGIVALLDGLWPLWDAKGQALHDKMAKTLVIDV